MIDSDNKPPVTTEELITKIKQISDFVAWREVLVEKLENHYEELASYILSDKIASTIGNVFLIIALSLEEMNFVTLQSTTAVLFIASFCTLLGANVYEYIRTRQLIKKFKEKLKEDDKNFASFKENFSSITGHQVKLTPLISSLFEVVMEEVTKRKALQRGRELDALPILAFSGTTISTNINISTEKFSPSTIFTFLASNAIQFVRGGMIVAEIAEFLGDRVFFNTIFASSVVEIVKDWTTSRPALRKMKTNINSLQKSLRELQDFCKISQFPDFLHILDTLIEFDKKSAERSLKAMLAIKKKEKH